MAAKTFLHTRDVDSRQIRGRNNKQPVLKVDITNFITGITIMVYTQEEIIAAATESNLQRQSQTVGTVFQQPALFGALNLYADNQENYLGVLDGSFIPHEDPDPYVVSLLEFMVQPQSHRDRGPINLILTPVENIDSRKPQKDKIGVLPGVPNNAHHKCCTYDPNINDIDYMIRGVHYNLSYF